jgi:hypothetical protein
MSVGKCKVAGATLSYRKRRGCMRALFYDIICVSWLGANRERRNCALHNDIECVGLIRDQRPIEQRVNTEGKCLSANVRRQADVSGINRDGA